ncbi:hypothetical protein D3C87_1607690 [compost metagenome]
MPLNWIRPESRIRNKREIYPTAAVAPDALSDTSSSASAAPDNAGNDPPRPTKGSNSAAAVSCTALSDASIAVANAGPSEINVA